MRLKIIHISLFIVVCFSNAHSQNVDFGFTLSPLTLNKLEFDKPAIILNDYYSYDIGKTDPSLGYPSLLGLFSSGLYIRYNKYSWYLKAELNYQTKSFRYTHESIQFKKLYFYYSCVEIPIVIGIRLNRENVYKYKLQTGVNIEIGKFNHNSFVSPFYILGLHINENKAMLDRINPLIYYYHIGFGFDFYGISVDLRGEKNLTNLNKRMDQYNANFTNAYTIRIGLGFKISGKHWDKFRKQKIQLTK